MNKRVSYYLVRITGIFITIVFIYLVTSILVMTPAIAKFSMLIYIAIPIIGLVLIYHFFRNGLTWLKGKDGEDSVHNVLQHLPSTYYALHDVTLGNTGNIAIKIWSISG